MRSVNTNAQIWGDYLRWFMTLNLLTRQDRDTIMSTFVDGGPSTCVLRTSFGDAECTSMFFDEGQNPRSEDYYLEFGRSALRALLDPEHQDIDQLRYRIVDDPLWSEALSIGANGNLGPLVGLSTEDPRVGYLTGDVQVITEWAGAMVEVGALVRDIRSFVGASDLRSLIHNNQFQQKRVALQKKMAAVVKTSKTRFEEPWGMVCLFWAGGSPRTAYAKAVTRALTTGVLTVERGMYSAPGAGDQE